ncbi:choice-of-anchor D domain-containing protein [Candidatus Zixiibacteriota bacterium]
MRNLLWAAVAFALILPAGAFAADSLLVDNIDAGYTEISGTWFGSTFGYLDSSRWCFQDTMPNATARFSATTLAADTYNIYYLVPSSENSSTSAKYRIHHAAGDDSVHKNQNTSSGSWVYLGAYDLPGDGSGYVEAINDTAGATGYAFRTDAMLWEAVAGPQDIHLVHFYHDFDIVDIGDSLEWFFDFSNVGGDTLNVSNITTSTGEFTVVDPTSFPLAVPPGATVDVGVKFLPFAGGNYADSVQILSDDPDSTEEVRQVQLAGKSGVLLVDDGDLGYSEPVGTTWTPSGGYQGDSRYALVSTDPGATAQWVPDVPAADTYNAFYFFGVVGSENSATGAKFKINHATGSDSVYRNQNLRSGEYWQFLGQHQFDAGTGGNVQMINDINAPGWGGYAFRADAIKLEVPTATQDLYVIDYSHDFGEVTQGQNKYWSFMAHNIGAMTLTIDSIRTSNLDFTALNPATPTTIPAGGTIDIIMRFTPSVQGEYTGESVTVYSDDGEFAPSVILEGTGVGNLVIVDNEDGVPWYTEQPDTNHWHNSVSGWEGLSRYNDAEDDSLWDRMEETATFTPLIPVADYYEVWWYIVSTTWVSENVEFRVHPSTGPDFSTRVSEYATGNVWKYLGTWYFDTDTSGYAQIVADTTAFQFGPVVRADAFKFLQAGADDIPPETVTDLMGEKSAGDISLSWTPVNDMFTGVAYYIVFRSTTPDFTPTSGDSIGEALTATYLDAGAAGTVGTDYNYVVQAVDNSKNKGDYSNEVGEHDADLSNVK